MTKRKCFAALAGVVLLATLVVGGAQPASAASSVVSIVTGQGHSCLLNNAGAVYCWGDNQMGQLGDGTTTNRLTPTAVSGGLQFSSISAGVFHTCALTSAGSAYCWGNNGGGRIGDGTTTSRLVPTAVLGGLTFSSISAGQDHTCGLRATDAAYCWGKNYWGEVGDGTTTSRLVPTAVSGGLTFSSISVGPFLSCALRSTGAAYCWGYNATGQVGDGTTNGRLTPTAVSGGLQFSSISAAGYHACGLQSTGAAYCWGSGFYGSIGDGTNTPIRSTPTAVSAGLTFSSISVGTQHTCALRLTGAAYCWGWNSEGQIGDGSTTDRNTPVPVVGGATFSSISATNALHTCGLTTTGVYCWGDNQFGQLGDSSNTDRSLPGEVWFYVEEADTNVAVVVPPSLTFTVSGRSIACNGATPTPGSSSSGSAVGLGRINSANGIGAQNLFVATNAGSGWAVYLRSTGPAAAQNGHVLASVPGTRTAPALFPTLGTEAIGYTVAQLPFSTDGGNKWAALTTTNGNIWTYSTSHTGATMCVAYQAGASSTTPAGSYSTTVIYTAAPIY